MRESGIRSVVKTITWRITGSSSTFLIVYFATNQVALSSGVAIMQILVNTSLYWIHERAWNRIHWGKQ